MPLVAIGYIVWEIRRGEKMTVFFDKEEHSRDALKPHTLGVEVIKKVSDQTTSTRLLPLAYNYVLRKEFSVLFMILGMVITYSSSNKGRMIEIKTITDNTKHIVDNYSVFFRIQ